MKVKFWGCRGSIPVPDSRMLKYGGNTTCLEFNLDGKIFIVDAGTGIRKLGEDIVKRGISEMDILITHTHWDHIQGFPFFQPVYIENNKINIYGCTNSYQKLKDIFAAQMSYEVFPISFADLKSSVNFMEIHNLDFEINGHRITTLQINHPIFTLGMRIEKNGQSFVFITDNELKQKKPKTAWQDFVEFCRGAQYLIHDAQFLESEYKKRPGWGHSTFEQALNLARDSGVKNLGFFHHDPNRRDVELDAIEKKIRESVKECGFGIFAVKEMDEIVL